MSKEYYTKTGITLTVIQGGLQETKFEVLVENIDDESRGVHTIIATDVEQARTKIQSLLSKAYKVVGIK
jgi:hypothetical protein